MSSKWQKRYLEGNPASEQALIRLLGYLVILLNMKTKIREKTLAKRNQLPQAERNEKNELIIERVETFDAFRQAEHILFYYSVNSEVDTLELIEKLVELKHLYLPIIQEDKTFIPAPIHAPIELTPNQYGIPEPAMPKTKEKAALDLILVPGVAFDPQGNRIGMGKGYYDRFLKQYPNALKVGLAYSEQMVEKVPTDEYDVPMDWIVSDEEVYECHPSF